MTVKLLFEIILLSAAAAYVYVAFATTPPNFKWPWTEF